MKLAHERNRELERAAEKMLYERVRTLGGQSIKIHPLVVGNPDRLVLLWGLHLVELKRPDEKPSLAQHAWHLRAKRAGVPVHVVIGTPGVRSWIKALTNANTAARKAGRPRRDCTCGGMSDAKKFFQENHLWTGDEVHPS